MKLTPEARADLLAQLRLHDYFALKRIMHRYGVSRRTLERLKQAPHGLAALAAGRKMRQRKPSRLPNMDVYEESSSSSKDAFARHSLTAERHPRTHPR
jgi:hypothetical protein